MYTSDQTMNSPHLQTEDFLKSGVKQKCSQFQKYVSITLNFCQRSTIHGLSQVAFPKSVRQRYFWLLICLSASVGMIVNNYYLIDKFLERPVLTNVLQDHTAFLYPELSFCFTNPIYFPPENSSFNDFILKQYDEYKKFKKFHTNFLALKIKFADYLYMTRNNTYTHPKWSVLVDCRYDDVACSYHDLIVRHLFAFGACYTFDYSRFEKVSTNNYLYGNKELDLVIYKAVDIPIANFGDPFETLLMPSGILLMIHDRHTWPRHQESYILNEYSQVNLKVINKHHLNIGTKCRPDKHRFSYYDVFLRKNLSVFGKNSDCVYEQVQNAVAKYCHCQWQEMQVLSQYHGLPFCIDGTIPFLTISNCLGVAFSDLSRSLDYCYLDDCEHASYETVISQTHFPALVERKTHKQWMKHLVELEKRERDFYGVSDLKKKALKWRIVEEQRLDINSISDAYLQNRFDMMDLEFVERNFMMIKIVPTSFFMDIVEESEEYPLSRLFSDIGGSVGLWLGASLISIFEVFDLLADLFETYVIIKQKENRIKRFKEKLLSNHDVTIETLIVKSIEDGQNVLQTEI